MFRKWITIDKFTILQQTAIEWSHYLRMAMSKNNKKKIFLPTKPKPKDSIVASLSKKNLKTDQT